MCFCSSARLVRYGGEEVPYDIWATNWRVHVIAHLYAARAVVPGMLERANG
jgi:hypothetical protein